MEDQSINRKKKVELSFVQGQVKTGVKTPHTPATSTRNNRGLDLLGVKSSSQNEKKAHAVYKRKRTLSNSTRT